MGLTEMGKFRQSISKIWEKIKEYNPIILNFLTLVLIIVTIFSCSATVKITKVSKQLDDIRKRDLILSQIDNTQKIISEAESNLRELNSLYKHLNEYLNSTDYPADRIYITRLENANDVLVGADKSLLDDVNEYVKGFNILKIDLASIPLSNSNEKEIKRTKQNVNVLLNGGESFGYTIKGLSNLIEQLKDYLKIKEKELKEFNKNLND